MHKRDKAREQCLKAIFFFKKAIKWEN